MTKVFTFWEGPMPAYIRMCFDTWHMPYTILTYDSLSDYTDLRITPALLRFTLPQIADVIRVHVIRDQGGYWLDADTVLLGNALPDVNMMGNPVMRSNTIGYLHADVGAEMFKRWAKYQDDVISNPASNRSDWSIMGNAFTDTYVKEHTEISIGSVRSRWPETYMIRNIQRQEKYVEFYFNSSYCLRDINPTDMLMLHNSWTPDWYKRLTTEEVLRQDCTLSNILREIINS